MSSAHSFPKSVSRGSSWTPQARMILAAFGASSSARSRTGGRRRAHSGGHDGGDSSLRIRHWYATRPARADVVSGDPARWPFTDWVLGDAESCEAAERPSAAGPDRKGQLEAGRAQPAAGRHGSPAKNPSGRFGLGRSASLYRISVSTSASGNSCGISRHTASVSRGADHNVQARHRVVLDVVCAVRGAGATGSDAVSKRSWPGRAPP
jgi:hypothetical protein